MSDRRAGRYRDMMGGDFPPPTAGRRSAEPQPASLAPKVRELEAELAAARQQLVAAQERIAALEGAIRLIRDQARPVMVGDAYLSATAEVPVAAVEAAASLLPDQPGREG